MLATGGAQWSGKSSVAQLLAVRHPLLLYAYDYHDARSHAERSRADPTRFPHRYAVLAALDRNPDDVWVTPVPDAMAGDARHSVRERFEMVLEDLAALPSGVPVPAEGWSLRVIVVGGRQSVAEVAATVEARFRPLLPRWRF